MARRFSPESLSSRGRWVPSGLGYGRGRDRRDTDAGVAAEAAAIAAIVMTNQSRGRPIRSLQIAGESLRGDVLAIVVASVDAPGASAPVVRELVAAAGAAALLAAPVAS